MKLFKAIIGNTITYRNRRLWIVGMVVSAAIVMLVSFFMRVSAHSGFAWTPVRQGDFTVDIFESGEILAVDAVYVKAPNEWRYSLKISNMVPEGIHVKAGDFLLQFDPSPLELEFSESTDRLKYAEAELRSIESQQATRESEQEIDLKIANMSREAAQIRVEQLKYESQIRQEEARLELEKELIRHEEALKKQETQKIIDYAEYRKGLTRVQEAGRNLEFIQKRIDNFTLRAPISGMVVYEEIGGWEAPRHKIFNGDQVQSGTAVMRIPDLSRMKMSVPVNEIDIRLLKTGYRAEIRLNSFMDRVYHGVVTDISPIIVSSTQRERFPKPPSFTVDIVIDEADSLLKPGMSAQARIILDKIPDALSVPAGAVFERGDGSTVVFTKRSYPDPVPVRLGKRNDMSVIVEQGLSVKDEVIMAPPSAEVHPIGWFAEMNRRETEREEYIKHLDIMKERGITGEPAAADSTAIHEPSPAPTAVQNISVTGTPQ